MKKNNNKILLIEDDKWLAESFERALKREFLDVKTLNNPNLVFDTFVDFWPDLIIADVLLGAQNLFVLLNEMQSYDDSQKIPIIILSSLAQQIDEKDVREFGVFSVLNKADVTPKNLRDEAYNVIKNYKNMENKNDKKEGENE